MHGILICMLEHIFSDREADTYYVARINYHFLIFHELYKGSIWEIYSNTSVWIELIWVSLYFFLADSWALTLFSEQIYSTKIQECVRFPVNFWVKLLHYPNSWTAKVTLPIISDICNLRFCDHLSQKHQEKNLFTTD